MNFRDTFFRVSESWLPIPGYEGSYEVSDTGKVRSLDRIITRKNRWGLCTQTWPGRVLNPEITAAGYKRVTLSGGYRRTVHSLVAEAFIGPRPEGLEICHNDGDKLNCNVTNLRYDTTKSNREDAVLHGMAYPASRTECPKGHPYVRVSWSKGRICRECRKQSQREYLKRRK